MAELDGDATELVIETSTDGGAPVLKLTGELDSSNADRLQEAVSALLETAPPAVIFEMGELRFMDSAGISVLVRLAGEVETVQIREPSEIIRRVVEITGLTSVLKVEP